jgi:DNA-damage-inducible protein D
VIEPQPTKGIAIFERRGIRRIWHDERWYFAVVDVIEALTDAKSTSQYWRDTKKRLAAEGDTQTQEKILPFKMRAKDGKMRDTECADTEMLLRIVQAIPSPKAEPFRRWLAQVGTERIAEADDPESAYEEWRRRAVASYVAKGYPQDWAEQRVKVITSRNDLTREWTVRGITQDEIPILTDRLHMGSFGLSIEDHKELKGYPTKDGKHIGNLSDGLVMTELAITNLGAVISVQQHQRNDSHGPVEIARDVDIAAKATAAAREAIEQVTGQPVVSPINAIPASNDLWSQLPAVDARKGDRGEEGEGDA